MAMFFESKTNWLADAAVPPLVSTLALYCGEKVLNLARAGFIDLF